MNNREDLYDLVVEPKIEEESLTQLKKLAGKLDRLLEESRAYILPQAGLLEQIGRMLWEASGLDPRALLEKLDDARDDEEYLRVIIQGDNYYILPWELLFHEHPDIGFLSLHPRCVLTRRIKSKKTKQPSTEPKPLKILLFISSPEDLDPERHRLDFEQEEELLFTALDGPYARGEIEIDVAPDGFLSSLTDRLSQNKYHAVIMSMHGTPAVNNKGDNEWGLLFENEKDWTGQAVAGSDLAAALEHLPKGHRPTLMVLSACRSARADETSESILDAARHLHRIGVERVLGMRLSVLDSAAAAFSAAFFAELARGHAVGRAVSLARQTVGRGDWLRGALGKIKTDPLAQWTLPLLLDRTSGGPVVDLEAPAQITPRPSLPDALPGDKNVPVPTRAAFIGRRAEIRQALGPFLEGRNPRLLFTGPGGVGKTALAGLFARHLMDRRPAILVMGFRAPFIIDNIYETIRQATFNGQEEYGLHDALQKETDQRERLRRMLLSLAQREKPCAFVLDNLETLQDLETLDLDPKHQESLWFVNAVCNLPFPTRVLMTGRYSLERLIQAEVTRHNVGEAPYGDILRRMKKLDWPANMGPRKKRWIYSVLGGNHRAMEWMSQLLTNAKNKAGELLETLEKIQAPADTPEQAVKAVTETMRRNLLFNELRAQLTPDQDQLLRAASLYRIAVNEDGMQIIGEHDTDHEKNRQKLLDYSMLEETLDRSRDLAYYQVPPIVREFLRDPGFEAGELADLHGKMGEFHRFQGEYVTRQWTDDIEAIYHFRQAEKHEDADDLAKGVSYYYYSKSNFAEAANLLSDIATRPTPPPPFWALNRFGNCQKYLGFYQTALESFENALPICPSTEEEGMILNNISQIHGARGDYETALEFLEKSLKIQREIGDKAGEGTTLNNMATAALAKGDYETALEFLEKSLKIRREIGDKAGEGTTLNNISLIYKARGDYETALEFLEKSLKIQREIGDKAGEGTTLNNMATAALAKGDYETALEFLEKSLKIRREIGDKAGEGTTLNNISLIYKARGDYETALEFLEKSLKIQREIGDKAGEGTTLNNMATAALAKGDYETALEFLEKSLKIRREIGDKAGEGTTLNNISLIYKARGDYETALEFLEKSLKIRREIGDKAGEGATLNNMATAALAKGDYETALEFLEKSLKIQREIGDKAGEGTTLNNISLIYKARGDYETALEFLEKSLKIRREIGDKAGLSITLHNMAHIALQAEDIQKAITLWSEAIELAIKTGDAMGLFNVGRDFGIIMARLGNKEEARQLLTIAIQVGRASGFAGVEEIEEMLNAL